MMGKLLRAAMTAAVALAGVGCKLDKPLSVQIVHVNDTHSHFDEKPMQVGLPNAEGALTPTYAYVGGYPRLVTFVERSRDEANAQDKAFLLLHAGDAFAGSLFFTLYKGGLNADFMNYMQFDAMTIGNHEFDLGNQALADFAERLDFPLLSANVEATREDPLHGAYLPFTIKMLGKEKQPVAIVGLTTEFTTVISSPDDTTQFRDVIEAAQSTVDHLETFGLNKIVFLTHLGLEDDRRLARSVPGIDVIIGGHSHTVLGDHRNIGMPFSYPSPIIETSPAGEPVCIMQSGEHALVVGTTEIDFTGPGIVESCVGQNTFLVGEVFARGAPPAPLDGPEREAIADFIATAPNVEIVAKDPVAQSMLDVAKAEVDAFALTEIGVASEPLYHVRLPGEAHPQGGTQASGSLVAPVVAESMASKMEGTSGELFIAVINAGGVRSDLEGVVTVGDAYSTLPFGSTLVTMSLPGRALIAALQRSVENAYGISRVTFPYVANVRYSIDMTNAQAPQVVDVQVVTEDGTYQPITSDASYNLVTTSYLAGGGDGYVFEGATEVVDTGHIDADALVQYVKSLPGGVVSPLPSLISLTE